jgi:hypothetical protein
MYMPGQPVLYGLSQASDAGKTLMKCVGRVYQFALNKSLSVIQR